MVSYYWRLIATAVSFTLFGVGGLAISLLLVPLGYLLSKEKREHLAKKVIHLAFRFFIEIMRILKILNYSGEGVELLAQPGQLIIANHPTLLDIVFLIARVPYASCIVKSNLFRNPFMSGSINFAGYIANDNPEEVIKLAEATLKKGDSLIIFPEGTRSKRNEDLSFLRGAANIAIRTQRDLCPVVISCKPLTLGKDESWYDIPDRTFHYHMSVKKPISITPYLGQEATLASRRLTQSLQSYFMRKSKW